MHRPWYVYITIVSPIKFSQLCFSILNLTGKAVDWWSFGVLIYEMLAGFPPFVDPNTLALFAKIKEPHRVNYPDFFTSDSVDLIQRYSFPLRRLSFLPPVAATHYFSDRSEGRRVGKECVRTGRPR